MIELISVPNEFLNTGLISNYPPHQKTKNIEAKLYEFILKEKNIIDTHLKYLPIQWTNYLVQNNKNGKYILQEFLNKTLSDQKGIFFSVVQYDGGPLVNIDNCIIFSSGGMFNTKLNKNCSFLPIPLLSDPHKIYRKYSKKFLASFIGRNTHEIRGIIKNKLSVEQSFNIKVSDKNFISKKDERNFKRILNQSYFSICPRGYGPASFRLYESFNLGIVPIYVSDEFHLPFKEFIDWENLCLLIKPEEIESLPLRLRQLQGTKKYKEMVEYGKFCSQEFFNYDFTIKYIINFISNYK